ncbi:stimulated by retinoic acid gene 6 protein-like [Pholidichthys leucotaenia]
MIVNGTENGNSTGEECKNTFADLFPHISLIPAVLIVGVLSFLQKRAQRLAIDERLPFLQGRFGIVVPLDTLGSHSNRWSYGFAYGAVSSGIVALFSKGFIPFTVPSWALPFVYLIGALEIGLLYLPFFACLSTPFRMAGAVLGMLYSAFWLSISIWGTVICFSHQNVIFGWPEMLSLIFLLGRYLCMLAKDIRIRLHMEPEDAGELLEQYQMMHVKRLLRKTSEHRTPLSWFKRKVYEWDPYFKFPCRMIGTVIISLIGLYMIILVEYLTSLKILEKLEDLKTMLIGLHTSWNETPLLNILSRLEEFTDVLKKCWLATTISASLISFAFTFHVLACYRKDLKRLWKGQKGFLPMKFHHPKSAPSIVSIARYSGWQIAFTLWGYLIAHFVHAVLAMVLAYVVILPIMHGKVQDKLITWGTTLLTICIVKGLSKVQELLVQIFFLQDKMSPTDKEKPLALNNRKAFHCFNYFFLFYNVVVGLATCMLRLLSSIAIGTWLISRIDKTIMQRGYETMDAGYCTWIGMIFTDHYHNNPVMVSFCQILVSNTLEKQDKSEYSTPNKALSESSVNSRARSRWTLAYTLLRNPPLVLLRKHHLTSSSPLSPSLSDAVVHAFVLEYQTKNCEASS